MERLFLSGPITGVKDYKEKFAAAAAALAREDRIILNPAVLPEGLTQPEYMRLCLAMADMADRIVMLPGWGGSKGATLEHTYAHTLGKPVSEFNRIVTEKERDAGEPAEETEPPAAPAPTEIRAARKQKKRYTGFLLIKCDSCGYIHANCVRKPITDYECPRCHDMTPLEDLTWAHVNCPECDNYYKYRTNIRERVGAVCLNCETVVPLAPTEKGWLKTDGWEPPEEKSAMKPFYTNQ